MKKLGRRNKNELLKDIKLLIDQHKAIINSIGHKYTGSYPYKKLEDEYTVSELFEIERRLKKSKSILSSI